jgi:micrococcal nuclease
MTKKAGLLLVLGVLGYVAAAGVPPLGSTAPAAVERATWFKLHGKATRVIDGDTLRVRVGARDEKVRLIGIDTPEVGECFATQATGAMRRFVLNREVVLTGDRSQTRRDKYGRLLAYVNLPSGVDVGRQLLEKGYAVVYETQRPFARRDAYEAAASAALDSGAGLNGACGEPAPTDTGTTATTPTTGTTITTATTATTSKTPTTTATVPSPPPTGNCAPSYPDVCIPPPPPDLDCAQIPYKQFRVIYTVPSPDPHRFDGDRDGIGCER